MVLGINETAYTCGYLQVTRTDADGNVVYDSGRVKNIETNYYANVIAQWLIGKNNTGYNPLLPPGYVELGTGSGTPAPTDTQLFAPAPTTIQAISVGIVPDNAPNTAQFTVQYFGTTSNAGVYTEAGLFDDNSSMFAHTMSSIQITLSETTTLTWSLETVV